MSLYPFFPTPPFSHSAVSLLERCELQYLLQNIAAHQGMHATADHHPQCQRAAIRRRISWPYGWAGALQHELFQNLLFAYADREKGRPAPTVAELCGNFWKAFQSEWDQSESYTPENFLRAQRERSAKFVPWLQTHAQAYFDGVSAKDPSVKKRYQEVVVWAKKSLDRIEHQYLSAFGQPPVHRWRLIEGKDLENGDVAGATPEEQELARAKREMPTLYWRVAHGSSSLWFPIRCTIDFAFWDNDEKSSLCIADLKDTQEMKEEHLNQMDLYGYFYCNKHGGIRPDQIHFKLYYPYLGGKIRPRKFGQSRYLDAEKRLKRQIVEVLKHFSALDEPSLTLIDLCSIFSVTDVPYLWAIAQFKQRKQWPIGALTLPETMIHTQGKRLLYPELAKTCLWVRQNLSPTEILYGFGFSPEEAEAKILKAQSELPALQQKQKEAVNSLLLEELIPTRSAPNFFEVFSVSHLLVPKVESFQPTMALSETPFHCRNCSFYSMCDPGQAAVLAQQERSSATVS